MLFRGIITAMLLIFLVKTELAQATEVNAAEKLLNNAKEELLHDPKSAFEIARKAYDIAQEGNNIIVQAQSSLLLGKLFFAQAAYNQALSHFLKALQLLEDVPSTQLMAETHNALGNLYYYLKREDKVLPSHNMALKLYRQSQDSLGMAETYGFIGHYHEKQKRYKAALQFQHKALSLLRNLRSTAKESGILSHLGSIHEDLQDYPKARHYFERSLALNDSARQISERISTLNNLGDVAFKSNDFQTAEYFSKRALNLARRVDDLYQARSALRDLSQLYASLGKHEKAFQYLDSSVLYYKQIYSEEGLKQVARLETFFEADKKEKEIRLLEKDRRINQLIICLVVAGLISAITIAVLQLKRQKAKTDQRHELFVAQEKLMKAQLENKRLSEIQLREQLENKSRSLSSFSLHLMEKNQLLQQLKSELNLISKTDASNPKRQIRNLSRNIDFNLSHEQDWEKFRQVFEEVHSSFFRKLSQRNPKLTHAEFKLAALMKMHLDSKEIADILNISMDSLRIARYRLRKKLLLEKDIKLSAYLHSL